MTASEWNEEAPTGGHVEALFAEKAVKKPYPEPTVLQSQALTAEAKPEAQHAATSTPAHSLPSAVPSATNIEIPVAAKSNDGLKMPHVVTFEVPGSPVYDAVTTVH